jgi:hypothetical protein
LVERLNGGWRITEKGRGVLEFMEARPAEMRTESAVPATESLASAQASPVLAARRSGRSQRPSAAVRHASGPRQSVLNARFLRLTSGIGKNRKLC